MAEPRRRYVPTYFDRVESYYYTSREDDAARDAETDHGPRQRRPGVWVAWMMLAVLIGVFFYLIASDDPDPCVGTPISTNRDCDYGTEGA